MTTTARRRLVLLAVLVLACAGCGGGGAAARTDAAPTPSTATPPPTTTTAAPLTPAPPSVHSSAPRPPSSAASVAPAAPAGRWQPPARTTWQYQLSGRLDLGADAAVFDVDWEDTSAAQVRRLHAAGRRVACYLNAGAFEDWRPDAAAYPAAVLGDPLDGWAGERWLDVRQLDVLLPIIAARMDVCRAKGFDAVDPDNVDGYANDTGFDLSAQDQLRFNRAVAGLAHDRGLPVGLKNDVEQIAVLQPSFDFAVNEQCLQYDECEAYRPFLAVGKPVFHVEYRLSDEAACKITGKLGLNSIFKDVDLGVRLERC